MPPIAASGIAPAAPPAADGAVPWNALTLRERAELLPACGPAASDRGLGERLAAEWREQAPFGDAALWAARLESAGVDEAALAAVLGAGDVALADAWAPEWAAALGRIAAGEGRRPTIPVPIAGGVLEPFAPFFLDAMARLEDAVREVLAVHPDAPFGTGAVAMLAPGLFVQAARILSRVLTLEMHVARLQGVLEGDTPESRFRSFVERLRQPEPMQALLAEYAPAARLLVQAAEQWVGACRELLERLAADRALLADAFAEGEPLGSLAAVEGLDVGDPHREGRSVAILQLSTGLRVVYKPRTLAPDLAFAGVLEWVGRTGACPGFRTPRVLDRRTHGWAEFVRAEPCTTPEQVVRYYERLGGLLAVLYLLDGQDMHRENLIAAGEHPVLVDLETLFHPPTDALFPPLETDAGDASPDAPSPGLEPHEFIPRSVLKTALLPQRMWAEEDGVGIDLSGVGGAGDQVVPGGAVAVEGAGTDQMRFSRVQVTLEAARNAPRLPDGSVDPAAHAEALDRGFTSVYRALAAGRGELPALLEPFRGVPVRVVLRMSQTYALLLREGLHPDFMRDALDRDRFFDKLWLAADAKPSLARVIPHEHRALHRGDVPVFTTTPDGTALAADTGETIPGFFRGTGLERVAARAAAMGDDDLARQRWLIRASLATLAEDPHAHPAGTPSVFSPLPGPPPRPSAASTDPAALVDAACEVAARLEALAVRGRRYASWLTLTTQTGRFSSASVGRYDLYGGLTGVLLFLSGLRRAAGTERFDGVARSAFATLREFLHDGAITVRDTGGCTGLGGIALALGEVAAAFPDLPAMRLAERTVERLVEVVDGASSANVFGGLAGAVGGMLGLHAATGMDSALAAAIRGGERLLALASADGGGPIWSTPGAPLGPSFVYGDAGVAWALLRLERATGLARFRAPALEALRGEWARWTAHPARDGGWARGAAGMALALLAARETGDDGWDAPLAQAVAAALDDLPRTSHALVNGGFGTLDALLHATPAGPGLRARIGAAAGELLADARENGWRCGVALELETPGLLNGIAGIGHALLRLADPSIPSVLTLGAAASGGER
jgi:type 2 lantibiotic biosynthesis protein LanM